MIQTDKRNKQQIQNVEHSTGHRLNFYNKTITQKKIGEGKGDCSILKQTQKPNVI